MINREQTLRSGRSVHPHELIAAATSHDELRSSVSRGRLEVKERSLDCALCRCVCALLTVDQMRAWRRRVTVLSNAARGCEAGSHLYRVTLSQQEPSHSVYSLVWPPVFVEAGLKTSVIRVTALEEVGRRHPTLREERAKHLASTSSSSRR